MTSPTGAPRVPTDRLTLDQPRSLAVYDAYEDAQRAVDYLSDHEFPVQNVLIVGTDLKQVERVTGRLTWGKVIAGGLASGMWLGAFVGLIFMMLGSAGSLGMFLSVILTGALFGVVWASLGYALTRGRRDFTSVSQVVATRYEVLVEHAQFDRAREMLSELPGGRGRMAAPERPAPTGPPRPNPYEGRYGIRTDEQGRPIDAPARRPETTTPPAPMTTPTPGPGGASAAPRPDAPRPDADHAPRHAAPQAADRHTAGEAPRDGAREDHSDDPSDHRRDDPRANPYEGRYGVRLPEGQQPPPIDEDAAPPNARD